MFRPDIQRNDVGQRLVVKEVHAQIECEVCDI